MISEVVDLEVRVSISPVPDFFRRIHFMAASLRRLKPSLGSYLLVICVGADVEPEDLYETQPWSKEYPIVWRWADREKFQRDSYWETSRDAFRQPTRARMVMFADADLLFVRPFAELLGEADGARVVAGVIAHAPPPHGLSLGELWPKLCREYGVPLPEPVHEYTGWNFMTEERFAPVYFNFGMVLASASAMETLGAEILAADDFVSANFDTFFRHQIALTLAIQKTGVQTRVLPLRYNFPNDPQFDRNYPQELEQIRILHYLRGEIVHRERDFADLRSVAALMARTDLAGSNAILRETIAALYPLVKQEEEGSTPDTNRGSPTRLDCLEVPDSLQRNAGNVLADGVENTGEWLLRTLAQRLGRRDLHGLDLLDVGCGVRFTQTLINRRLPFASYTGVEVSKPIVQWLKANVEQHDTRFHFEHWNVRNSMYNPAAPPMQTYRRIPGTETYDVIVGYSLFTHLSPPDTITLLGLMRDVVRDDGYLFFTAFCDDEIKEFEDRVPGKPLLNAYYTIRYLEELLRGADWQLLSHKPPDGYMMDSFLCRPEPRKSG